MHGLSSVARRQRQRGLSLVEAMVGITVGLIIVAGATMLATTQITEHRRLMTETQMQQDLRAAADLVLHDIRRASFWEKARDGVWAPGDTTPIANPYALTVPSEPDTYSQIEVRISSAARADSGDVDDNTLLANERRTFSLSSDGELLYKMSSDSAAQPLTDKATMIVDDFKVTLSVQSLPLIGFCDKPCPTGSTTCPEQQVRHVLISITGHLTRDASVSRTVQIGSRLRNDRILGACPA